MYLGVKAILAKSYARIHRSNLINFGLLPLTFKDNADYQTIQQGDRLRISHLRDRLKANGSLRVENVTQQTEFDVSHGLSLRDVEIVLAGGLLNYIRQQGMGM